MKKIDILKRANKKACLILHKNTVPLASLHKCLAEDPLMPYHITVRIPIDPELVKYNISEMSRVLAKADDPELIEAFLYSLFTNAEADEIAKRWALVKRLAEGTSQRAIAEELKLSLCKITRGSRELKKENSPFKRILELAGYEVKHRRQRRPQPKWPKLLEVVPKSRKKS